MNPIPMSEAKNKIQSEIADIETSLQKRLSQSAPQQITDQTDDNKDR